MKQKDKWLLDLRIHGVVETEDDENFRLTDKFMSKYKANLPVFQHDPKLSAKDAKGCALTITLAELFKPESFQSGHVQIAAAIADLTIWKEVKLRN